MNSSLAPGRIELDTSDAGERLVLERRGDRARHPHLLFLGSRVKKRLDNKFTLSCIDLRNGKIFWETKNLRLRCSGQEPGFFEAFVVGDLVVVHGLFNVLAFDVNSGKARWHFRVPFDFEIRHASQAIGMDEKIVIIITQNVPKIAGRRPAFSAKREG